MKKKYYITLVCLLAVAFFAVWHFCERSTIKEENVQLMPPFKADDDDIESVWRRLGVVASTVRARNENTGTFTEEYLKVSNMENRYAYRRGIHYAYIHGYRDMTAERREELFATDEYARKLTDEEIEFLNHLIQTRKITMDINEKN